MELYIYNLLSLELCPAARETRLIKGGTDEMVHTVSRTDSDTGELYM